MEMERTPRNKDLSVVFDKEDEVDAMLEEIHVLLAEEQNRTEEKTQHTEYAKQESAGATALSASYVRNIELPFSAAEKSVVRNVLRETEESVFALRVPEREEIPADTQAEAVTKSEEPELVAKQKKKGKSADIIFFGALIALVLAVLLVKIGGNGAPISVFGLSVHNVLTSSMQDEIPKDSLVLTQQVDAASLQIGDDITYMRDEKTTVTHRIIGIIENYEGTGKRAFETKGIMNKEKDRLPVLAANVVGKVIFHNHALGVVMIFFNQYWYFVLLFVFLFIGLFFAMKSWRKAHRETKDKSVHTT